MKNLLIREAAAKARVMMWEIAAELGITDFTFSRRLRKELPEDEQRRILDIIQRIKDGAAS